MQQNDQSNRLKVVDEHPVAGGQNAAMALLLLALKSLSQRFVIALNGLWSTASVASSFWLFYSVRDNPSTAQLILSGVYGGFILAAIHLKR